MKKKYTYLCCAIFMLFCQYFDLASVGAVEISESQEIAIIAKCNAIREDLKVLQHNDSRARVYLGRYYETILTKYITPLNVRLVENTLPNSSLLTNQTDFTTTRANFVNDYIEYQKSLEELVSIDCKAEPIRFYAKLVDTREKRKKVAKDVTKARKLLSEHYNLVLAEKKELK